MLLSGSILLPKAESVLKSQKVLGGHSYFIDLKAAGRQQRSV